MQPKNEDKRIQLQLLKERAVLTHDMHIVEDADSEAHARITAEINAASARIRRAAREATRKRVARLFEDIGDASDQQRMAECYRLCTTLAGKGVGPRRRRLWAVTMCRPGVEEWRAALGQEGRQGGMSAKVMSFDEERHELLESMLSSHNSRTSRWGSRRPKILRGCVESSGEVPKLTTAWSAPVKLNPAMCRSVRSRKGMQQVGPLVDTQAGLRVREAFENMIRIVRHASKVPIEGHRAQSYLLDKHNGKPSCVGID